MMGMNEITGGKLFPLFTGQQDVDKIRQNGEELISFVHRLNLDTLEMDDCRCSIHEGNLECVKDVFNNGNLRSLSTAEFLLMILWIRENLFMMDSLQNDERCISIGLATVGDAEKKGYFFTPKRETIGEDTVGINDSDDEMLDHSKM